jgi:nicotinamide-nucleotide amidase
MTITLMNPPDPEPSFDLDGLHGLLGPLGDALRARGWRVAAAESCTGGLIAAACTALAGSSDWFDRGFVTYSNAAKSELLGVPATLIDAQGAVSEPVAQAMAAGALVRSAAHVAVAVTGIAGPGGGSAAKPVGLVWMAIARRADATDVSAAGITVQAWLCRFGGDRAAVRSATVREALAHLMAAARA